MVNYDKKIIKSRNDSDAAKKLRLFAKGQNKVATINKMIKIQKTISIKIEMVFLALNILRC